MKEFSIGDEVYDTWFEYWGFGIVTASYKCGLRVNFSYLHGRRAVGDLSADDYYGGIRYDKLHAQKYLRKKQV